MSGYCWNNHKILMVHNYLSYIIQLTIHFILLQFNYISLYYKLISNNGTLLFDHFLFFFNVWYQDRIQINPKETKQHVLVTLSKDKKMDKLQSIWTLNTEHPIQNSFSPFLPFYAFESPRHDMIVLSSVSFALSLLFPTFISRSTVLVFAFSWLNCLQVYPFPAKLPNGSEEQWTKLCSLSPFDTPPCVFRLGRFGLRASLCSACNRQKQNFRLWEVGWRGYVGEEWGRVLQGDWKFGALGCSREVGFWV